MDGEQEAGLESAGFLSHKNDSGKGENKGAYKKILQ